ncbi:RNA-binding protein NOB1 isoform X1 [Phyllopteryx taeniolatus]|uniref:RNA-binding protein NOB1 isoform X1 n=1 Tax=Phyllopteryx taeniolatus TaxID=161469 RepID=UPI002AD3E426|nr:RNA-binding protein NOB1 isoform X1 [Phyllopteryx taeniolatus]
MAQSRVEHVVADAAAFLNKVPLQDIAKNVYTLKDVVDEIRDKATRRSLAFLPYQLDLRQPRAEHVRLVTEFSKKTGDYPGLSSTDIKVVALTLQLEEEHVGTQHLRKEPRLQVHVSGTRRHPETPVSVAGFHFPSEKSSHAAHPETLAADSSNVSRESCDSSADSFNSFQFWREVLPSIEADLRTLLGEDGGQEEEAEENENEEEEEEEEEEEDDDDDDGGGGWITPSNIEQMKMDSCDWTTAGQVKVGCMTTDFAMQNVLIQMGLHVVSMNGMLIKQARNYILRCHACFTTTSNMSKQFCPKCGNRTLKKVSVSVNEDGQVHMHFSKNPKVLNTRGLRVKTRTRTFDILCLCRRAANTAGTRTFARTSVSLSSVCLAKLGRRRTPRTRTTRRAAPRPSARMTSTAAPPASSSETPTAAPDAAGPTPTPLASSTPNELQSLSQFWGEGDIIQKGFSTSRKFTFHLELL